MVEVTRTFGSSANDTSDTAKSGGSFWRNACAADSAADNRSGSTSVASIEFEASITSAIVGVALFFATRNCATATTSDTTARITRTSGSFRSQPGVSRNRDRAFTGLERDADDRVDPLPGLVDCFDGCDPTRYTIAMTIMMTRKVIRMGST